MHTHTPKGTHSVRYTNNHSFTQRHTQRDVHRYHTHTLTFMYIDTLTHTASHTHGDILVLAHRQTPSERHTQRHTLSQRCSHAHAHSHTEVHTHTHTALPPFPAHTSSAVFVCPSVPFASLCPDIDHTGVLQLCSCLQHPFICQLHEGRDSVLVLC